MIFSAHQPNFMPYLGYFYKIFVSDKFAFSDKVLFSRSGFHNYNFIPENGQRKKITLPVDRHSGSLDLVNVCSDRKPIENILKTIYHTYCKSEHFKEVYPIWENALNGDKTKMIDVNTSIITGLCDYLGIKTTIIKESDLCCPTGSPSEQIVQLCKSADCDTYLSGTGAKEYLEEDVLKENGIRLLWSKYTSGAYGDLLDLSVIDYVMRFGSKIPEQWKIDKEEANEKG